MKVFIKAVFFIFLVLLVISGIFTLLGSALSLTFGILGAILSIVWKIVSHPVVLVLAIVLFVYLLKKASPSK